MNTDDLEKNDTNININKKSLHRRKSSSLSTTQSEPDLDTNDPSAIRRFKNREAAKKCREKKKEKEQQLKAQFETELETERQKVRDLQSAMQDLEGKYSQSQTSQIHYMSCLKKLKVKFEENTQYILELENRLMGLQQHLSLMQEINTYNQSVYPASSASNSFGPTCQSLDRNPHLLASTNTRLSQSLPNNGFFENKSIASLDFFSSVEDVDLSMTNTEFDSNF